MANWTGNPTWNDKSKINNGNLYDGESKVTAEDINNIFENILYIKENMSTGGGTSTVQLFTPTITINQDQLTITPNVGNGNFVEKYQLFYSNNNEMVWISDLGRTQFNVDLSQFEVFKEAKTYTIYVTANATGFLTSIPAIANYEKVEESSYTIIRDIELDKTLGQQEAFTGGTGTSVGNYAILAGGASSSVWRSLYAISGSNLAVTKLSLLKGEATNLASATIGDRAYIIGGTDELGTPRKSEYITSNLTQALLPSVEYPYYNLKSGVIGNYAVFMGGFSLNQGTDNSATDKVLALTTNGTVSNATLNYARTDFATASISNFIKVCGGKNGSDFVNWCESITPNLTVSKEGLANVFLNVGASIANSYTLFAGGLDTSNNAVSEITAFDKYGSPLAGIEALSQPKINPSAINLGNFVIFAGGRDNSHNPYTTADVYDKNLVKLSGVGGLAIGSEAPPASASIGNYAFFGNTVISTYKQTTV
jgi:hypothetical protein